MTDGRKHRNVRITRGQARYLRDLIEDDLAQTDLSGEEQDQARVLLGRLDATLTKFANPDWADPQHLDGRTP